MEKPIVLVIMDGVGKGDGGSGDAVVVAKTPTLDHLLRTLSLHSNLEEIQFTGFLKHSLKDNIFIQLIQIIKTFKYLLQWQI